MPEEGTTHECCAAASTPGGGTVAPDGTVTTIGPRDDTTLGTFEYNPTACGGFLASATDPTDPQELH